MFISIVRAYVTQRGRRCCETQRFNSSQGKVGLIDVKNLSSIRLEPTDAVLIVVLFMFSGSTQTVPLSRVARRI